MVSPPLVFFRVTPRPLDLDGRPDLASRPAAPPDARSRAGLVVGAVTVAVGLALLGAVHPDVGGPVTLAGWLLLGGAIHRYGRSAAS